MPRLHAALAKIIFEPIIYRQRIYSVKDEGD
ncbi:hypothetical protein M568_11415 [Salmonella enterica subsp. enterica serovar Namur str. 05-2929]|nr:hypothetical protein CFSAN001921_04145 [Salmonella enterica subsp. enterica serovar Typhimurium var. 5- str. CFSAN001921]AGQ80542.1 hypothetical protein CFSAN002069_19140 [Salmonella enterica subsp. enterica serovar Heidelberg str. CFSAN002069]AGQ88264.1 hypothetical protein SE451236_18845 [Salmonella enterica subsp. enterica serovar 4,[5],12:i:- str. 08-1736]AHB97670.1 hypothetical protein CFSAN002064_06195 [Salmonella enterica subsp. enterica serovar Heidelberg str. CFSAN002064]AHW21061.1 